MWHLTFFFFFNKISEEKILSVYKLVYYCKKLEWNHVIHLDLKKKKEICFDKLKVIWNSLLHEKEEKETKIWWRKKNDECEEYEG